MKRIILLLALAVFVAIGAGAQDKKERKLTKQERKALEARMDSLMSARARQAVYDTAFVVEADEVTFKRGYTAHVTSDTNFIAVCGGEAVVQVAFNVPWPGFNGLGGITVDGYINKYERTEDEKGNVYVQMSVNGRAISAQVFITLWAGTDEATVSVQQNFYSGRITLNGKVVPVGESRVYKAMPV